MSTIEKEFIKTRVIFYISMLIIAIAFMAFAIFFYWNTANYRPFVFTDLTKEGYIKVDKSRPVRNGEYVTLLISYAKTVDAACPVKAEIVGVTRAELSIVPPVNTSKPGKVSQIPYTIRIPEFNTMENRYIEFTIDCPVNPVRNIHTVIRTESFPIVD